MTFVNFDMFAAKQPPMDSIINDQASGASTASQGWQFGSFAPPDTYSYVIIAMPYNDTLINDSVDINLSAPTMYDENWGVVWNGSRGDTSANLSDDFIAYNDTLYRSYIQTGGLACSKTDTYLNVTPCYVNTTSNMVYMKIPHFSGVGPTVATGSAPVTAAAAATSSSSGGGSSTNNPYWTSTKILTDQQFIDGAIRDLEVKGRMKFSINSVEHSVGIVALTSTTATINISSTPQQATFSVGQEKKFDVNADGYYDVYVKLNSIAGNKASVTIKSINEKIPAITTPTTTTTPGSETSPSGGQSDSGVIKTVTSSSLWIWIIAIAVVIILIIIVVVILWKKRTGYVKYKKGRFRA